MEYKQMEETHYFDFVSDIEILRSCFERSFWLKEVEEESNASAALDVRGRRRVGYDEDKVVIMGRGIIAL